MQSKTTEKRDFMRKNNKFFIWMMAIIMVVSLALPMGLHANAIEVTSKSNTLASSDKGVVTKHEEETLTYDNQGRLLKSSNDQTSTDLTKEIKGSYTNEESNKINYTDFSAEEKGGLVSTYTATENSEIEKPKLKAAVVANTLRLGYDTLINNTNGTITTKITIVAMTGTPPVLLMAGNHLYAGNTYQGSYNKIMDHTREIPGTSIKPGLSYSKTYKVVASQFWIAKNHATAGWVGAGTKTTSGQTLPELLNKKGVVYPNVTVNVANKATLKMTRPTNAKMKIVPVANRTKWTTTTRTKFRNDFEAKYNVKIDWTNIQIHHMLPLQYGGTNAFSNLLPINTSIHQKIVSPWWTAY